ncbi:MAG: plastocyanin/azurin family copper-binding protein [Halobacteriales archaeon]
MERRIFLTATTAVTLPFLAGCGGDGDGDGEPDTTDGSTPTDTTAGSGAMETVSMVNTSFDPREASIDVGTTVKWVNNDSFTHDVTSKQFSDGAASWDFKETVGGGGSVTHTFDSEGVYEYYCTIHGQSSMCGVIVVGDVSYGGSLPCGSGGSGGGGY